jgi:hypothetical protein
MITVQILKRYCEVFSGERDTPFLETETGTQLLCLNPHSLAMIIKL